MKVFVSTAMRCGSTWVAKLAAEMLGVVQLDFQGVGFSRGGLCKEDREELEKMEGVIKLHSSVPLAVVGLGKVVTVRRDWLPSLVSNFIYNLVVREQQGLELDNRIKVYKETHDGMSVEGMLNGFLVSNLDWVDETWGSWKDFSKVNIHKNILNLKFEELKHDGAVILKLAKFLDVSLTMKRMKELREGFKLENFKKVWGWDKGGYQFVNSGDDNYNVSLLEPTTIKTLRHRYEHL